MKRSAVILGLLVSSAALLPPIDADARPGGGSSFKGSSRPSSGGGSSYRSSSSGGSSYRSSSSSSTSSWSSSGSSRSSSGSSYSSSSSSSSTHTPQWAYRESSAPKIAALSASPPGTSPYPAPAPKPLIPMGKDQTSTGVKAMSFVFSGGLFTGLMAIVCSPLFLVGYIVSRSRRKKGMDQAWSSGSNQQYAPIEEEPDYSALRRKIINHVQASDHDFSLVIFEDFLAALYTEAHVARASQSLERYSPYLRPAARHTLANLGRNPVTSVIVGAIRPHHFSKNEQARMHRVVMEIESNYTEMLPSGGSQAYYALERWTLARAMGTRSRPPNKARALVCPNCGAPLERTVHGRCMYCSQAVDSGQFDWVVERIEVISRETRGPMLTGTTEEQGTNSPTIFDSQLAKRQEELVRRDPSFTRENVEGRVRAIFSTMQHAWSSLDWKQARPYLTDRLWNAQIYWIEAYRQQGLRNITEGSTIKNIELVRISYDKWYQSITVRIHATGFDYTMAQNGEIVGGSKTKERPYTEYWTLVRSTARKNAGQGPAACCLACGAPLPGQMTDKCGHCGALVEASSFDWALSRIEQDDVYRG